jgi:hypothetical protein
MQILIRGKWVAILISDKVGFGAKTITRDREEQYIKGQSIKKT